MESASRQSKKIPEQSPTREFFREQVAMRLPWIKWSVVERALKKRDVEMAHLRPTLDEFVGQQVYIFNPIAERKLAPGHIMRNGSQFKNFSSGVISADKTLLENIWQKIGEKQKEKPSRAQEREQKMKMVSETMEAVLYKAARQIFGKGAEAIIPTEFGDVVEGTDLIVIFRNEQGEVDDMIAIDLTYAGGHQKNDNEENVHVKKNARGMQGVVRGSLHTVSHVRIPVRDERGRIKKDTQGNPMFMHCVAQGIPRVVLSMNQLSVLVLAEKWINGEYLALEHHPKRKGILNSILKQLEAQRKMAPKAARLLAQEGKKSTAVERLNPTIDRIKNLIDRLPNQREKRDWPIRAANRQTTWFGRRRSFAHAQQEVARKKQEQKERRKKSKA